MDKNEKNSKPRTGGEKKKPATKRPPVDRERRERPDDFDRDDRSYRDERPYRGERDSDGRREPPREDRAPAKKSKKAARKEKIALEKQLVKEGKILPRYAPRSRTGRLIALCLSFFFGFFAAIGGIVGTVVYFGTRPVKQAFNTFHFDYSSYLTETAADKTAFELVSTVASLKDMKTLNALAEYTPLIGSMLDKVDAQVGALGIHLDRNEIMGVEFSGIGQYFSENVIKKIVVGELLKVTGSSNSLMVALCYGKEGEDYEIVEGEIHMLGESKPLTLGDLIGSSTNDLIGNITVEAILDTSASSNPTVRYLAYGSEGYHYRIEDGAIVMLENPVTGEPFEKKVINDLTADGVSLVDGAKISDLTDTTGATGIIETIKDWTIGELKEKSRIERLRLSQIITIGDDASPIMRAIKDWRVSDLTSASRVNSLTLSDVISIDENSAVILRSLADTTIGEFGTAVNELRLTDILGESAVMGNKLLKNLAYSTLDSLADDIADLSVADLYGNEMYAYLQKDSNDYSSLWADGETSVNYADIIKAYKDGGYTTESGSAVIPVAVTANEEAGEKIVSYFYDKTSVDDTNRQIVKQGIFERRTNTLLASPDVRYKTTTVNENTVKIAYVERELTVLPVYEWRLFDFELGQPVALPETDGVATKSESDGLLDRTPENAGTPVLNESGEELYYTTPDFRARICEDGYGFYYRYVDNAARIIRVDMDRVTVSYRFADSALADETVTLTDGKIVYEGNAIPAGTYSIRTRKASGSEKTGDFRAAYEYVTVEAEVEEKYYYTDGDGAISFVSADSVAEGWRLVRADQTYSELDRYLTGVWYLLFGSEETDADGNFVVKDNTTMPLFDISKNITQVTDTLNEAPLWQLYFHGILTTNPYAPIRTGSAFQNVNEMTLTTCINFIKETLNGFSG